LSNQFFTSIFLPNKDKAIILTPWCWTAQQGALNRIHDDQVRST